MVCFLHIKKTSKKIRSIYWQNKKYEHVGLKTCAGLLSSKDTQCLGGMEMLICVLKLNFS